MFSFFKKKAAAPDAAAPAADPTAITPPPDRPAGPALPADIAAPPFTPTTPATLATPTIAAPPAVEVAASSWWKSAVSKLSGTPAAPALPAADPPAAVVATKPAAFVPPGAPAPAPAEAPAAPPNRQRWLDKLRNGLRKTGSSIAQVFTGTQIDDALYDELEAALLMADAGVRATEFLLQDLKRRVKEAKATDPAQVKALLADALAELLAPLEKPLEVGRFAPTVMMVVGVNGAGKTTSIGKLTRHLAEAQQTVLLAAADTFRAAAREQLAVWADRNRVEIVSQEGADPAAVAFDAVTAGKARRRDVVIADTAGRLPTQIHLMDELRKIQRVIGKADAGAPHEVLLVVDGTAKGGVLAAIARERPVPVYFIGVGEKLEDLQTFSAREFAQALLA